MSEKEAPRERDVGQIVRYLTSTFNQVISKLEKPQRSDKNGPNESYLLTREFAYLLNEFQQGPRCLQQKHITDCNNFLDNLIQDLRSVDSRS